MGFDSEVAQLVHYYVSDVIAGLGMSVLKLSKIIKNGKSDLNCSKMSLKLTKNVKNCS